MSGRLTDRLAAMGYVADVDFRCEDHGDGRGPQLKWKEGVRVPTASEIAAVSPKEAPRSKNALAILTEKGYTPEEVADVVEKLILMERSK